MNLIASDNSAPMHAMLEGYDCPAILVSSDYQILATNREYESAFGKIEIEAGPRCYQVSHGYDVPCDRAGEDCPLGAAKLSGHKERVLHIHQTPRGKEHVDVEMIPIHDQSGKLVYFIELLHPVPLASGDVSAQELIGESQPFKNMLERIARVGQSDAAALLIGESGTGKELAAQAIHMSSSRKNRPMVTLECAGLTETLFESELFGHIKGAFTGANSNKKGLVELADGGTLFLDELGDIPLPLQVKLLRLLETGTFRPVGSAEVRTSDFRLISATHRNLVDMVEEGSFRRDLYYRINVFPIYIPSLAERGDDISLIANAMIRKLSGKTDYHLTGTAIKALKAHPFQGNIRELRNILSRAIVLADTNVIDATVISRCFEEELRIAGNRQTNSPGTREWVDLKTLEKAYLKQIMEAHDNDKDKVASILGISVRSLYRKLEDLEA